MGKLILVKGENSSGKSAFAEKIVAKLGAKKYYIATMIPKTEDNFLRIKRHRRQREKYGFRTLELPYQAGSAEVENDACVLLEDVSNLLANNMFEKGNDADYVFKDILRLKDMSKTVVAVTISGIAPCGYDEETEKYIDSLNEINQRLFEIASVSITMKDGEPFFEKGDIYDFF